MKLRKIEINNQQLRISSQKIKIRKQLKCKTYQTSNNGLALQDKKLLEEYKAEIKDLKALTMAPHDDGEKEVTSDKQPEPENSTPESQPKPKKWWRFGKQLQLKKKEDQLNGGKIKFEQAVIDKLKE